MRVLNSYIVRPGIVIVSIFLLNCSLGCQTNLPIATNQMIAQQAQLDMSGLTDAQIVEALKIRAAPPQKWDALPVRKTALYTHEQWRSPSRSTGMGVAYVRLPIPLPVATLLWFAKAEYNKHDTNGKVLHEWNDSLGRYWFEGENKFYHCKGYIVVNGTDAWFVYYGYKTTKPSEPLELNLAARALDTVIPQTHEAEAAELQANLGATPSTIR